MQKPELENWDYKPELEGLLIFAQSLDEMLFHHTVDSFKAPALNTHTNAIEFQFLISQCILERIAFGTLQPISEELRDRIRTDPAIDIKGNSIFRVFVKRIEDLLNKNELKKLFSLCDVLISELDKEYWNEILEKIDKYIRQPKEKEKIIALASSFITEAEYRGFSRSYIYFKVQEFFFSKYELSERISSVDSIKEFLKAFSSQSRKFRIVFRGSEAFNKTKEYSEIFRIKVTSTLPEKLPEKAKENKFLKQDRNYPLYIYCDNVEEKDPITAKDVVKNRVEFLAAFYSFICHDEDIRISDDAFYVSENSDDFALLKPYPNPMKRAAQRGHGDESINDLIEILQGNRFKENEHILFGRSINYHRAAIEAKTPENQLLDLWASLEGFLPSPEMNSTRIHHYLKALVPSLILTYPEKIFRYITDSLFYGGSKPRKHIEKLQVGKDFFQKAVALIVTSDLEDERIGLYSKLENHPLLKYRVFRLNEYFKDSKHIKKATLEHKTRVRWHIQRIYSSRNQIIHSADALPYLSTLVENLHTYLDTLFNAISVIGSKTTKRLSIRSTLEMLSVLEEDYFNNLENDEVCTSDTDYATYFL